MRFSLREFAEDAAILCRAFGALPNPCDDNNNTNKTDPTVLVQWELKNDEGTIYMVHPAVLRNVPDTVIRDEDDASEVELKDILLADPDAAPSPPQQEAEWNFSIVYSDTWMIPVLYFTVKHCDSGTPYLRSQVLQMLNLNDDRHVEDTWDFLSYDEHPVTGEPSFFLHPCQTSDRLGLLFQEQTEQGAIISPLLSWMNMILPAVGFQIPLKTFVQVHSIITNETQAK